MMKFRQFSISALMLVMVCGCTFAKLSKETKTGTAGPKKNKAWLLAGNDHKSWTIVSFSIDGADQLSDMKPCELDNVDVYSRNQVYETFEGESRCNPNDPELKSRGKWSFNADSSSIEIKLGSKLFSLQLLELSETILHYTSVTKNGTSDLVLKASAYDPLSENQTSSKP